MASTLKLGKSLKGGVAINEWREAREDSAMLRPSRWPHAEHKASFFSETLKEMAAILQQTCSFTSKNPRNPPSSFPPEPSPSLINCTVIVCYSWSYSLTSTQEFVLSSLQQMTPIKRKKRGHSRFSISSLSHSAKTFSGLKVRTCCCTMQKYRGGGKRNSNSSH